MRRKSKWIAVAMIGMFLVNFSRIDLGIASDYVNAATGFTKEYSSSHFAEENVDLEIDETNMYIYDLPDREEFLKIVVSLYAEDGQVVNQQVLSGGVPYVYSMEGVPEGEYYVQLYYLTSAEAGKSSFTSYWYQHSGVKLNHKDGEWNIVKPVTFTQNQAIYQSHPGDEAAQKEALEASYYIDCKAEEIVQKAKMITQGIQSDYDKVLAVHDWVANNVWYDYDFLYGKTEDTNYVATEVLRNKNTICAGYANLTAALLRSIGIPTRISEGYALGVTSIGSWTEEILSGQETNHAWNESYVDGRWVIYDVTWDSAKRYENGTYSTEEGLKGRQYFDPTIQDFSATHLYIDADYANSLEGVELETMLPTPEPSVRPETKTTLKPTLKPTEALKPTIKPTLKPTLKPTPNGTQTSQKAEEVATKQENIENVVLPAKTIAPNDTKGLLEKITPNADTVHLYCGGNVDNDYQLLYYDVPSGWKTSIYTQYSLDNAKIASISSSGLITAKKRGITTLTILFRKDGYEACENVRIEVKNATLSIFAPRKTIATGKTITLGTKLNGVEGTVKWKSSNTKIASISKTGKLKGKKKGSVKITASIGKVKKSITIKVKR